MKTIVLGGAVVSFLIVIVLLRKQNKTEMYDSIMARYKGDDGVEEEMRSARRAVRTLTGESSQKAEAFYARMAKTL